MHVSSLMSSAQPIVSQSQFHKLFKNKWNKSFVETKKLLERKRYLKQQPARKVCRLCRIIFPG